MHRYLITVAITVLVLTGCTSNTNTPVEDPSTKQASDGFTITYKPLDPSPSSDLPGIEEVGNSRWGAKYTIFVSPEWRNPMVFELVPDGHGGETKVRILPIDVGSFPITAKTNPSLTIITYLGEDGARHQLCTMKGVGMFVNLQPTGMGFAAKGCEFRKVFLHTDMKNVAAQ